MDGVIVGQRELSPAEVRSFLLQRFQDEMAKRYPRMRPFEVKQRAQKMVNAAMKHHKGQTVYALIEQHPATRLDALKAAYLPAWLLKRWPVKYRTVERW